MVTRKRILLAVSLGFLAITVPNSAFAEGERGTKAEEERYQERESQTPRLEHFTGGCCVDIPPWAIPLIILAIPVALPIYGVVKLVEATENCISSLSKKEPTKDSRVPPPARRPAPRQPQPEPLPPGPITKGP